MCRSQLRARALEIMPTSFTIEMFLRPFRSRIRGESNEDFFEASMLATIAYSDYLSADNVAALFPKHKKLIAEEIVAERDDYRNEKRGAAAKHIPEKYCVITMPKVSTAKPVTGCPA